jgi:rSAM/selenodomain-associated transferase 1
MEQPEKSLLIIFYRNPQAGKVKTRLAATMGAEKALGIFVKLSSHIKDITENITVDKMVFYSDVIVHGDLWTDAAYLKALQRGSDLGIRMKNAFDQGFRSGYTSISIIGTDCFELSQEVISRSFEALVTSDAVIGPARDGGYYLLGMKRLYPELFENKPWSTDTVFRKTIEDFDLLGLKYTILPVLRDVDTEDDVPQELLG